MKKIFLISSMSVVVFLAVGCRTLDPSATKVAILDRAPNNCKNLGTVNVDWSWWGDSTESLNAMRNQTADRGGNAVLLHGSEVGTAYNCPEVVSKGDL
jgi:hypothetical protein